MVIWHVRGKSISVSNSSVCLAAGRRTGCLVDLSEFVAKTACGYFYHGITVSDLSGILMVGAGFRISTDGVERGPAGVLDRFYIAGCPNRCPPKLDPVDAGGHVGRLGISRIC